MPRCFLGLGGNVGDVATTLRAAVRQLADSGVAPLHISRLYRSTPVGPQAGSAYLNACVDVETTLSPQELLGLIHRVEDAAGRSRDVRWGPRTLDIDILACDELVLNDAELILPHPGLVYRRFVLDPLAKLAPQWRHPVLGRTAADLQQRLQRRPLPILLIGADSALRLRICAELQTRFPDVLRVEIQSTAAVLDPTAMLVDSGPFANRTGHQGGAAGISKETGTMLVRVDSQVAEHDLLAATIAIVTAMLDEPQIVGEVSL